MKDNNFNEFMNRLVDDSHKPQVNKSKVNEVEIVSKEEIAKELYDKSFAELSDEEKDEVNKKWKSKLMGRESKVSEQLPEDDDEPIAEPEELPKDIPDEPVFPEDKKEDEGAEITKEYVGRTEDTHYYLISKEEETGEREDLQIVDQEGILKYSAKDNNLELEDPAEFVIKAIQDVEIDEIERSIFMKYILPLLVEEEEPEEEEELEDEEEIPELGKKKKPKEFEPEEEEEPFESKKKVKESKKKLTEMTVIDGEDNSFEVSLIDDGTDDTVLDINGKEFRFSGEFASLWRDDEGNLSEEGLQELALDALANLEDEEYNELVSVGEEQEQADVESDKEGGVVGDKESGEVGEKKKPPICKKCGKRHWPFQKCSGKKSKGDNPCKKESKGKNMKNKVNEGDVSKDVKALIKATTDALKDGDYVKAAELSGRLSQIQQVIPDGVEAPKEDAEVKDDVSPPVESADEPVEEPIEEPVVEEGKVPDDKDSEETKIKKLTEKDKEDKVKKAKAEKEKKAKEDKAKKTKADAEAKAKKEKAEKEKKAKAKKESKDLPESKDLKLLKRLLGVGEQTVSKDNN